MTLTKRAFIRRSLLLAGTIAGAGHLAFSGTTPAGLAGHAPQRKFKIQLNGGLIGIRTGQLQLNELAWRLGFESVTASASFLRNLGSSQLQELLSDMDQKKISFGLGLLNLEFRKTEEEFQKMLDNLPRDAEALQQAGVTRVCTWIMSNHSELNYLRNFRLHTDRLKQVASVLEDYNIRLGLEYVGPRSIWSANRFPFIHTLEELQELIAAINKKNVGIHLDTAHWFTAGESIESIYSLKNEEIIGCDLNDALPGIEPITNQPGYQRELPATTGVIDIKAFLTALVTIGYDGFIQAEPFNAALEKLGDEEAAQQTILAMRKAVNML